MLTQDVEQFETSVDAIEFDLAELTGDVVVSLKFSPSLKRRLHVFICLDANKFVIVEKLELDTST